jgi:hypothetical protein
VTTGAAVVEGAGADFRSPTDLTGPTHIELGAAGDICVSPPLFGVYQHMWAAAKLMGSNSIPNKLAAEFWCRFTANANEDDSGIGFIEDAGAANNDDDFEAAIVSNGTNFLLMNGANDTITGPAVNTTWNCWRIEIDFVAGVIYWYHSTDGITFTKQGTSIPITQDEFPVCFGGGVRAATGTNFILMGPGRVYYAE